MKLILLKTKGYTLEFKEIETPLELLSLKVMLLKSLPIVELKEIIKGPLTYVIYLEDSIFEDFYNTLELIRPIIHQCQTKILELRTYIEKVQIVSKINNTELFLKEVMKIPISKNKKAELIRKPLREIYYCIKDLILLMKEYNFEPYSLLDYSADWLNIRRTLYKLILKWKESKYYKEKIINKQK